MVVVTGCAIQVPREDFRDIPDIADVPFFPQTEFDCGPAALATILGASGKDVTPEVLMPQVYTAGLNGSLQVELLAATRQQGRVPILITPTSDSLIELVAGGHPVLVLQNLRFRRSPLWHYAVVVGFEGKNARVVLRSGAERRKRIRARRFVASWELAENWGFVAVRPGEIPGGIEPANYVRAVVDSERLLDAGAAAAAYAAGIEQWPNQPAVLFVAAVNAQQQSRIGEAETLYRRTLALDPYHSAARNNLANVLLEQGCLDEAASQAQLALVGEPDGGSFRAAIEDTLESIDTARLGRDLDGDTVACQSAPPFR